MAFTLLYYVNLRASITMRAASKQADLSAPPIIKMDTMIREHFGLGPEDEIPDPGHKTLPPEMDEAMKRLENYVQEVEAAAAPYDRFRKAIAEYKP